MKEFECCPHARLLHDSWGCKMKCGCGVSIIYLTSLIPPKQRNPEEDQRILDQGKELDANQDRLAESRVRMMTGRSLIT